MPNVVIYPYMEYIAGLFDAEGCVTANKIGVAKLIFSNTSSALANVFVEHFGGKIFGYDHQGKNHRIFQWYCPSTAILHFCSSISPYSLVKRKELEKIFEWKSARDKVSIDQLRSLKQPIQVKKSYFANQSTIKPDQSFYKWFAGFLEGDGQIGFHERSDNIGIFTTHIGAKNTFPESIQYINERIMGSIASHKTSMNKIAWCWICSEHFVEEVCQSILPYLRFKKEACQIVLDFLKIKKSKRRNDKYSPDQIFQIRGLLEKLKISNKI